MIRINNDDPSDYGQQTIDCNTCYQLKLCVRPFHRFTHTNKKTPLYGIQFQEFCNALVRDRAELLQTSQIESTDVFHALVRHVLH